MSLEAVHTPESSDKNAPDELIRSYLAFQDIHHANDKAKQDVEAHALNSPEVRESAQGLLELAKTERMRDIESAAHRLRDWVVRESVRTGIRLPQLTQSLTWAYMQIGKTYFDAARTKSADAVTNGNMVRDRDLRLKAALRQLGWTAREQFRQGVWTPDARDPRAKELIALLRAVERGEAPAGTDVEIGLRVQALSAHEAARTQHESERAISTLHTDPTLHYAHGHHHEAHGHDAHHDNHDHGHSEEKHHGPKIELTMEEKAMLEKITRKYNVKKKEPEQKTVDSVPWFGAPVIAAAPIYGAYKAIEFGAGIFWDMFGGPITNFVYGVTADFKKQFGKLFKFKAFSGGGGGHDHGGHH